MANEHNPPDRVWPGEIGPKVDVPPMRHPGAGGEFAPSWIEQKPPGYPADAPVAPREPYPKHKMPESPFPKRSDQ